MRQERLQVLAGRIVGAVCLFSVLVSTHAASSQSLSSRNLRLDPFSMPPVAIWRRQESYPLSKDGRCGDPKKNEEGKGTRCPMTKEEQAWLTGTGNGGDLKPLEMQCCSELGFCGGAEAHCGAGCQEEYGTCTGVDLPSPGTDLTCGPMQKNKTCPMPDQCCSSHGYCGTSRDYCKSPDCLVGFGLCDANIVPQGRNTSWVDRSMPENIRITMQGKEIGYGVGIYHCVHPGTVALTFDDGPYNFTSTLLDTLDEHHFKATFFVTGVNIGKGPIDDPIYGWDKVIRRMYNTGHQIASHTWSHADLDKLSEWDRRNEMYKLEMALRNIIGVIPTYMRPPYSSCSEKNGCLQTMRDMGYHVVYFDLDTQDYLMQTAEKIQVSKDIFSQALNPANSTPKADSHLVIAHDITEQSAKNLTVFMVEEMARMGWKGVTVGECLEEGQPGMGEGGWYRVAENETERSERLQREEGNPVTTGVDDTERGGGRDQWRGQPNAEDNKSEGQGLRVRGVGIWVVAAVVGGWLLGL